MPKPRKQFKPLPMAFRASCPESCEFALEAQEGEAKLKKFSMTAYTGAAMNVGFGLPVVVDIEGVTAGRQDMPILKGHNHDQIVGHTTEVSKSPQRIRAAGLVSGVGDAASEVVQLAGNGFPWQASIGGNVLSQQFVDKGEKVTVNGRAFAGPLYVVRKFQLNEISFVSLGADGATSANVAAAANHKEREMNEFDKWLVAMGFDKDHMEAKQVEAMQETFDKLEAAKKPAEKKTEEETPDPLKEIRAGAAAESKRIAAIRKVCAGKHDEIEAKAIEENWTTSATELEVLKARLPKLESNQGGSFKSAEANVLEAALAQAGKLEGLDKQFEEKTLDAAHKRFKGRVGLQQILLEAAWEGGYEDRHFPNSDAGRKSLLRAAFSTVSLPGIMSNTANKFLLEGFGYVERVFANISATRNVPDFKTVTSYRMLDGGDFEKVGPGGELKHGTLSEESFTNKAETYGKMMAITRQDIINDDLGALSSVPRRLGRKSGLALNDVFWTLYRANTSFFPDPSQSFLKGATTTLTATGLGLALKKFRTKTEAGGTQAITAAGARPLAVEPKILLVPVDLEVAALTLMGSMSFNTGGSASTEQVPNKNIWANRFRVEVTSYLHGSGADTAYYLLADPNDIAVIEVCYLNGQQSPTIESADADFSTLGVQMRGYFDFGVAFQDARGGLKVTGAA